MLKYNGGKPRAEVLEAPTKLKSAVQLQDLLDATRIPGRESDSDPEDLEHAEKLRQVKAVLEEQRTFWNGAGRKFLRDIQEGSTETAEAEELGRFFRYNMYPGEGTGLLRIHSTYRHDLKIYSSDEGRVQVSLVSKDSSMLDGLDTANIEMEAAKTRLNEIVTPGKKMINKLLLFIIIKS
ncbi:hypothetical protein HID58_046356 [Brassica napus]|uniref:diphosphoinositol-pentakisphosphate 1-kinase n=1 Tax=Brassica napus TaxID=3708 RepID=A0ABQ8AWA9_BRANA|nr:hypothetical protein HID58_046356 [Brassica napus]